MLLFAVPNSASAVALSGFQHTHTTSGAQDEGLPGDTLVTPSLCLFLKARFHYPPFNFRY